MSTGSVSYKKNRAQNRKSLFSRVLLAGLIFQSVAIGGAYATGRETVQYAARFGSYGTLSVIATFALLSIFAFLVFELCRKYEIYDYRSLLKLLIGRAYWLYDFLYLLLGLTIVGVLISASGSILLETLGVPSWVTTVGLVIIVAIVLFYGQAIMERFNSLGTILLTAGFILFAALVLGARSDDVLRAMAESVPPLNPSDNAWSAIGMGLIYGSLYLCIFPSTLPVVRFTTSRSDTLWSAFNLGWLIAVPLFLTYFSVMAFYPDDTVMDAEIPWLVMLSGYGPWVVVVFGILVGWTLLATAVGMIQGALTRISASLVAVGRPALSGRKRGAAAAATLLIAVLISLFGIIDLVAMGYTAGAWGMLIVFGGPLLTRGVWLITKDPKDIDYEAPSFEELEQDNPAKATVRMKVDSASSTPK